MFLSFNPFLLLFWIFVANFIPGALVSFSVFRKEKFTFLEKMFIGFGIGIISMPLIPFLLYFLGGVAFSGTVALASIAVFYAIALVSVACSRLYEDFKLPEKTESVEIRYEHMLSFALLLVIIVAFLIRLSSYSPVFQELDPYYYTYTAYQLLDTGYNPQNDGTAWYPDVEVNHRIVPELSYLEATWYSLYTGGGELNNLLLANIATVYPPVAAALAVFFLYLFMRATKHRELAIASAAIASFLPIFIFKLTAGEQEVQPYAFFALSFFYAMYKFSISRKGDYKFAALAGLGFAAVALGSSSQLLALVSVILFMAAQSVLLFLKEKDASGIREILKTNAIVFVLGPLLGSAVLKDIFSSGSPSPWIALPFLMVLAFVAALYFIKKKAKEGQAKTIFGALVVAAVLVVFMTPLGDYMLHAGKAGFQIAQYNAPLDRTIAEQGTAGRMLQMQMGFVAESFESVIAFILSPVHAFLAVSSQELANNLVGTIATVIAIPFSIISLIVNITLSVSVSLINSILGSSVQFEDKANSFLLLWIFLFIAAIAYSFYEYYKKGKDNQFLLYAAIILPPLLVGIIKAKYTIYAGYFLCAAIAFVLNEADVVIPRFTKKSEKSVRSSVFAFAALLVLLQFFFNGTASSLLFGSFTPLYQNNPFSTQAKFSTFCAASGDPDVCAAANDPMGYASLGTNYQYSQKLCALSILSDYSYYYNIGAAPPWEQTAVQFRCQRIAYYWTESMEWINENTEEGSRTTSWWDYGHWINYFGERNAVLRNEHASHEMIGEVAHSYIDGTPKELAEFMKEHDSKYALFDAELVMSSSQLGGKFGALNYLSCAHMGETNVSFQPGGSECELGHLWEKIFVPIDPARQQACEISSNTNKTGIVAYRMYLRDGDRKLYMPFYDGRCINPTGNGLLYCQHYLVAEPAYCLGNIAEFLPGAGEESFGTYYLNETYPNGNLKINKAALQFPERTEGTYHFGEAGSFTMIYTMDEIWLENGELKSGYEDRKTEFYESNLYRALFLNDIPGFRQVFSTSGGEVKIYRLEE